MPVFDASALVEYLAGGAYARDVAHRLTSTPEERWIPHLADAETGHVLRKQTIKGTLHPRRAAEALDDLAVMPVVRMPHHHLLQRAFELRENLSFYDALYVALAEALNVTLVTLDGRMARAARRHVTVDLIGDG